MKEFGPLIPVPVGIIIGRVALARVSGLLVALTITGTTRVELGYSGLAVTIGTEPVPTSAPPVLRIGVGMASEEFDQSGASTIEIGIPVPTEGATVVVTRTVLVSCSVIVEVTLRVSFELGEVVGSYGIALNISVMRTAVAVGPTNSDELYKG
jgi:hypothetical protein